MILRVVNTLTGGEIHSNRKAATGLGQPLRLSLVVSENETRLSTAFAVAASHRTPCSAVSIKSAVSRFIATPSGE